MSAVVWAPIRESVGEALAILDAERRLYVGLSHDRTYWHVVQPQDGSGELVCTCRGGRTHGRCWRTEQALAFEAGHARAIAPEPEWLTTRAHLEDGVAFFDAPAGAGEMVEASRG